VLCARCFLWPPMQDHTLPPCSPRCNKPLRLIGSQFHFFNTTLAQGGSVSQPSSPSPPVPSTPSPQDEPKYHETRCVSTFKLHSFVVSCQAPRASSCTSTDAITRAPPASLHHIGSSNLLLGGPSLILIADIPLFVFNSFLRRILGCALLGSLPKVLPHTGLI
jgi:hypothetical protein